MQLFLPGLVTIIVAGVFIFFVIPRVSPTIIFIISIIFLFIMIQSHYSMFANEYKLSSWKDKLRTFATPILISIMVIGLVIATSQLFNFDVKSLLDSYSKISNPNKVSNI